ncbi:MAG TPA: DNA-formamidopyrimidine glycosylase family protein, partial [Geobacteraceae bacterium]|nr:DNA-formamidopyrimidine glycosylase family protein [Geobacteraceae bacterium]
MPELPEVETTRRGLAPHLTGRTMAAITLRAEKLRHPLSPELSSLLPGRKIEGVTRRGKYLLLECTGGTLLIHLGMTGHLRLAPPGTPLGRYDHVEIRLDNGSLLRL